MSARLVIGIVCFLFSIAAWGQARDNRGHEVDSLLEALNQSPSPETTVRIYNQLAEATPDKETAWAYQQQALEAALKTNTNELIAEVYTNLGRHHRKFSDYLFAIPLYKKALNVINDSANPALLDTYLELGIAYLRMSKLDSSAFYLTQGISITSTHPDPIIEASLYNMMGNVLKDKNDYKNAIDYYLKATEIFEQTNNDDGLTQSLANIGNLQNLLREYDKALDYALQSLAIAEKINKQPSIAYANRLLGRIYRGLKKYDEALLAYERAIRVYEASGARRDVSETLTNIGNIYFEKQNLAQAKTHYQKSLQISKAITDSVNMAYSYSALGLASSQLKENKQATLYLDSSIRVAKRIQLPLLVMDGYSGLSELYARQKNYELAYIYHKRYAALSDSITQIQNRQATADLEARYQNEKKENEIRALTDEYEISQLRLQKQNSQRNYLIGVLLLSLIVIALFYRLYRIKQKTTQKLEALNETQSRFFANISHEFRTPLTLIIGPLQQKIEQQPDAPEVNEWKLMHRNAVRLHRLIDQILDLSKIESGNMQVQAAEGDLKHFLKLAHASFSSLANQKQITYTLHLPEGDITGIFDRDKLEKIVYNLLFNALKFTPQGGAVALTALQHAEHLSIQVADTGPGVPEDKLTHIFDRFYQAGETETTYEGTGLGLALSKELAHAHHGTLTTQNRETGGSIFTLTIPIAKAYYKNELVNAATSPADNLYKEYATDDDAVETTTEANTPVVLIAEDETDMRAFIKQVLANEYTIITAEDGKDAWEKILNHVPDLVISDLMMPGMDGNTLCKKLKAHEAVSHIPVILLTARADQQSKLEGLHIGADDYLTKPFDARELYARVQNLIAQREKLKVLFAHRAAPFAPVPEPTPEAQFLNKIIAILEKNYANADFGVEEFTREIGMSRMQLHRKLKALTDKSPGDFLRLFRLERAKKILAVKGVSVSEAAYQSGFNNLPNFSRLFKTWTGQTPSEYQENQSESPSVTNQQDIVTNP
ncbi:MAG: tetratricopeptide repeat protein [Cyclobacteriaceae bacterium]|nr:tetratricopeptide repeat protein [Cyclobacteriaceae bacterium]